MNANYSTCPFVAPTIILLSLMDPHTHLCLGAATGQIQDRELVSAAAACGFNSCSTETFRTFLRRRLRGAFAILLFIRTRPHSFVCVGVGKGGNRNRWIPRVFHELSESFTLCTLLNPQLTRFWWINEQQQAINYGLTTRNMWTLCRILDICRIREIIIHSCAENGKWGEKLWCFGQRFVGFHTGGSSGRRAFPFILLNTWQILLNLYFWFI